MKILLLLLYIFNTSFENKIQTLVEPRKKIRSYDNKSKNETNEKYGLNIIICYQTKLKTQLHDRSVKNVKCLCYDNKL